MLNILRAFCIRCEWSVKWHLVVEPFICIRNIFGNCQLVMLLYYWPRILLYVAEFIFHYTIYSPNSDILTYFHHSTNVSNFSHGCALINRLYNEPMFDILGSILEYNKSSRIFKNANAGSCISYDRCSLDNVSSNMYTTVARLGR